MIAVTHGGVETKTPTAIPVYSADGRAITNAHIVFGQISLPGSSQGDEIFITLNGEAAFTSADSYKCFLSKPFGAGLLAGGPLRRIDGSHFAFRGGQAGPAWQQDFFCIGN